MTQIGTYRYGSSNKLRLFRVVLPVAIAEAHAPQNEDPHQFEFDGNYDNATNENISTEILTLEVWAGDKPKALAKVHQALNAILDKNPW